MAENWRKLQAGLERLVKQNPDIQTIADGLERNARRLLKTEHIKTTKKFFFLDDPPKHASPLAHGCYEILRDIHFLRQAIARRDASASAYHAFYIGRQRQVIIATRDEVWKKMKIAEPVIAAAGSARRLSPSVVDQIRRHWEELKARGMTSTSASRKLSAKYNRSPRRIRDYLKTQK